MVSTFTMIVYLIQTDDTSSRYHTSDSHNSAGHPPNAMGGCLDTKNHCSGQEKDQDQARGLLKLTGSNSSSRMVPLREIDTTDNVAYGTNQ